jgi:hypothetical protein
VLSLTLFVHIDAEHGNAEANADTRAFADTYNQRLKDDDQEFAYLEEESQLELEAHTAVGFKNHEDNEDEDEEDPQEYISPDEMRRLVRERAKGEVRLISLHSTFLTVDLDG